MIFLVLCLSGSAMAQEGELVIGKDVKTGITLKDAFTKLGIPDSIQIIRGTDALTDSLMIAYPEKGLTIYVLGGKTMVEGIELAPSFKGSFVSGIRLGDGFNKVVGKYGVPQSLTENVLRYPAEGLYFLINKSDKKLLSAKVFSKNSKLLEQRLANPISN